jgi:membrane-associated PAP2 superfamily phosphatase
MQSWRGTPGGRQSAFYLSHGILPLAIFAALAVLFGTSGLDPAIARGWAYAGVGSGGWIGRGAWWADRLLHDGGRALMLAVVAAAALGWAASWRSDRWRPHRSRLAYAAVAMISSWALVGLLKQFSHVPCPWSLAGFGGALPYSPLFGPRVTELSGTGCFPGAHSASAFSLFAAYFAVRDDRPRLAWPMLALALALGALFALAQEARGAHFLSHDIWSAAIAWSVCLVLYQVMLPAGDPADAARSPVPSGLPADGMPGAAAGREFGRGPQ